MQNNWVSLTKKVYFLTGLFSILLLPFKSLHAQSGEELFTGNCTSCHAVNKKMIGPALKGARQAWAERTGSDEAIIAWIKNSQGYIKETGDPYAVELLAAYNGTVMTPMALSSDEVVSILDYIDNWEPPVAEAAAPVADGDGGGEAEGGNPLPWIIVLAVILFIVVRVLVGVNKSLENLRRQQEGEDTLPDVSIGEGVKAFFMKNQAVSVIVIVLIAAYLSVLGWDSLNAVGVYQGYEPSQPIWFSHKIHAGQNGINCVYCHNSVEKGKSAGIPSVNICMNCHMGVKQGKVTGSKEIAKIYEAIGWDTNKNRYIEGYDQKPIEWVRIHNLQDFVYFNHSQHVVVGKQDCENCHGPVKEMDVMYQHSELTMGWCINCHRETNVSMQGNEYYDKIHADLVEKYKDQGLETFTVEQIGGLECGKCHY